MNPFFDSLETRAPAQREAEQMAALFPASPPQVFAVFMGLSQAMLAAAVMP